MDELLFKMKQIEVEEIINEVLNRQSRNINLHILICNEGWYLSRIIE
jgi:hypothetical protein